MPPQCLSFILKLHISCERASSLCFPGVRVVAGSLMSLTSGHLSIPLWLFLFLTYAHPITYSSNYYGFWFPSWNITCAVFFLGLFLLVYVLSPGWSSFILICLYISRCTPKFLLPIYILKFNRHLKFILSKNEILPCPVLLRATGSIPSQENIPGLLPPRARVGGSQLMCLSHISLSLSHSL